MKVFYFVIALFVFSCGGDDDDDCSTVLPEPDWFEIAFVDSQGNQLINNVFVKDSFKFSSPTSVQYLKPVAFGSLETLQVGFTRIESGETYSLELDENNIDQLRFDFTTTQQDCGVSYVIGNVFYNQMLLDNDGSEFGGVITFTRE